MAFTLEDIGALRSRWRDPIVVCELPIDLAGLLGVRVPLVHLSTASLQHINRKHPEITDTDLQLAALAVRRGWFLQEVRKPNTYLCSYFDPETNKRWAAALKVAQPDLELYLLTFHRAHRRQTIAWQKRCRSIRNHL